MKNIQLFLSAFLILATLNIKADTTTQSTGLVSGDDGDPTTASITVDPGNCVAAINSITIDVIGSSYTSSFCTTNGSTSDWYSFDLLMEQ